jgi:oligopeptide/dipeptide ABC transporter ATP-binding protein
MTIGAAVREPMAVHRLARVHALDARVRTLFGEVGLDPALMDRYPHELSGGQRQRAGIARALSVEPEFVVLDEPVSALDVSVQAQVLNLLADLRERRSLTYLFIAHDLAVIRHLAERVAVMYFGAVVEIASTPQLFAAPAHPYTGTLLAAVPVPDPLHARRRPRAGEPGPTAAPPDLPSTLRLAHACRFYARCPHPAKDERCRQEVPPLRQIEVGRWAACHYAGPPVPDRHPA